MKKSGLTCRILSFIVALCLLAVPVAAVEEELNASVTQGCRSVDAQIPMLKPSEDLTNLFSAFLYDITNDTLVYSVNPDQTYYPAGLVKIMTGLLIAERGNLSDQVTVRQEALNAISIYSMSLDFKVGEVISLQDLLYCVLVEASNDAAVIAADYISGSQEAFVQEMNAYAKELGCTNTNFVNAHGLHEENQITTARDTAKILLTAIENDAFFEAFSTVSYTVPATNMSEARELTSSNYIMTQYYYLDSRVTGGRTGIVHTGERNLAVTAEKNDVELICIVLGSASILSESGNSVKRFGSFSEASDLLDIGFNDQHAVQVFYENQVVKQYSVVNGDSYVTAYIKAPVLASMPRSASEDDLVYNFLDDPAGIQAPVEAGNRLSAVQVWYGNVCLAQADLFALHDVDVKDVIASEELQEEAETSAFTVLLGVIIIVGLLIILLFGRRFIFRVIRKRQVRKHRTDRRRSR